MFKCTLFIVNECEWCTYLFRTLLGRTHNRTHLQCLRTHLPLTPLPLTRSYQPLVEEEEEEEEEEYLRSDTLTCVSITEYPTHAQTVMNLVNKAGQRARNIFDQLDRRLKSADKKEQSGDRGQGVGGQGVKGQGVGGQGVRGQGVGGQGREGAQKKKMSNKGPSDNPTHTKPSTVPV